VRLLQHFVVVAWLVTAGSALATECDCLPEFATTAEATGVCSTTKDDQKWCKLKFGAGATQPGGEKNGPFTKKLQSSKISDVDVTKAVQEVGRPPEQWTLTTVQQHVRAMFAIALWDTAPARLQEVLTIIQEQAQRLLMAVKETPATFSAGKYQVDAAKGCIQINEGSFSTMLRTRYAQPLDDASRREKRCGR
jgi:hypothetical protein